MHLEACMNNTACQQPNVTTACAMQERDDHDEASEYGDCQPTFSCDELTVRAGDHSDVASHGQLPSSLGIAMQEKPLMRSA